VEALTFSLDGKGFAAGCEDMTVWFWAISRGAPAQPRKLTDTLCVVKALAFPADGKTLASGSDDQSVRLWDVPGLRQQARCEGHGAHVTALAFSPQGRYLASTDGDGGVFLWDPKSGNKLRQWKLPNLGGVCALTFAPAGPKIALAQPFSFPP
jgi:WD40 repeat protein